MRKITYNGETHTFKEWCRILQETSTNDDLRSFAEALDFDGRLTNEALYTLYTMWCGDNCLPKDVFEKRIVSAFKKYRPDIRRYRTKNVRGWELWRDSFFDIK